jgi:DNA-binding transcriptional ArsR family regulator
VLDVEVIDDPAAAAAALDPVRARLLAELGSRPGSATTLAPRLGIARQKLNYHLRTLESHGLVRLVEERPRRGLVERVLVATATSYVVSPAALGDAAADPDRAADRLSARYLIALAARVVREVGDLVRRADRAGQRLATLSIDTRIRFSSAGKRAEFTRELAAAVTDVVARYHEPAAAEGREYRLLVAAHPLPSIPSEERKHE